MLPAFRSCRSSSTSAIRKNTSWRLLQTHPWRGRGALYFTYHMKDREPCSGREPFLPRLPAVPCCPLSPALARGSDVGTRAWSPCAMGHSPGGGAARLGSCDVLDAGKSGFPSLSFGTKQQEAEARTQGALGREMSQREEKRGAHTSCLRQYLKRYNLDCVGRHDHCGPCVGEQSGRCKWILGLIPHHPGKKPSAIWRTKRKTAKSQNATVTADLYVQTAFGQDEWKEESDQRWTRAEGAHARPRTRSP